MGIFSKLTKAISGFINRITNRRRIEEHASSIESSLSDEVSRRVDLVKVATHRLADDLIFNAIHLAPDGSKNPDKYTGFGNEKYSRFGQRPSARLGEIPIRDSLDVEYGGTQGSGEDITRLIDGEIAHADFSFPITLFSRSRHSLYFTAGVPPFKQLGTAPHSIAARNVGFLTFNSYGYDQMARIVGYFPGSKKQAIVIGPGRRVEKDFCAEAFEITKRNAPRIIREVFNE